MVSEFNQQTRRKIIPAWQVIKLKIIGQMTECEEALFNIRDGDPHAQMDFMNQVLVLYVLIKAKLPNVSDQNKYKILKRMDNQLLRMDNSLTQQEWVDMFLLLQEAIEELGVTKIEVKEDEPPEPGEDIFEGLK